jgi:hypothetical protein
MGNNSSQEGTPIRTGNSYWDEVNKQSRTSNSSSGSSYNSSSGRQLNSLDKSKYDGYDTSKASGGLTQKQYDYLNKNYTDKGFIANPSRVDNYSNPAKNIADRNWQEVLRKDSNYGWDNTVDKQSYSKNCDYGGHNAGPDLDKQFFK